MISDAHMLHPRDEGLCSHGQAGTPRERSAPTVPHLRPRQERLFALSKTRTKRVQYPDSDNQHADGVT